MSAEAVLESQAARSRPSAQRRKPVDSRPVKRNEAAERLPVVLLTPTGQDARMGEKVLGGAGFRAVACKDMSAICELISKEDVGVIVVAEEALIDGAREQLFEALDRQPTWSDVPIVVLTGEDELSAALPRVLSGVAIKANVTLLERPVRVATLTTVIRSGLRARQRQLDVKAHLEDRHAAEVFVRESEARLRAAVQSAPYPLMLHASDGEILQLSEAWMTLTGYYQTPVNTTDEWERLALGDGAQSILRPADDNAAAYGESVALGEHVVHVADGRNRVWDFHRVALGRLPDGRSLTLTAAIDITPYRDLLESERAARKEAEEANAAKSQFLATMSHELRTPLNAIAGYAQLLTLGVRGPITKEQRADLDRIDRSQRHLLSLINDVLNFAKIEAGHVTVATKPITVEPVILSLKEFVEPQLREKALHFEMPRNIPVCEVCGDPDKVRQILINLLSNAIKFTPEGGHISLECEEGESAVFISVRDDGAGIPEDKLEAIFEPFVQVSRDYASKHEGTGLGLSISRDLARRMGGDLTVLSTFGEGSTFTLAIPRA